MTEKPSYEELEKQVRELTEELEFYKNTREISLQKGGNDYPVSQFNTGHGYEDANPEVKAIVTARDIT